MFPPENRGSSDSPRRRYPLRWSLLSLQAELWLATPALAYGPAEHLRECFRTAELLSNSPGPLGQLTQPAQRPWLSLGCVAPDFRQASDNLSTVDTHSWKLGLHLLKAAQLPDAPTGAVAFAVGHLAHHASDGAESVYAAALAASGLLGAPDLFPGTSDAGFGECEMWVEVLGEFANGDLAGLVDLLSTLGAFGPATVNWQAMLKWYVVQANLWSGTSSADPATVVAEIEKVIAKATVALAGFEPESVQVLLDTLKSGTPASAVQLLAKLPIGDALQAFGIQMGSGLDPLRWRPLAKLPAFASYEPWHSLYALPFADMGPKWTTDLVHSGKLNAAWPPSHNSLAMQAGARTSLAWGMPAGTFAPQHAVLTDELAFLDAAGKPLTSWKPGGGPITVRARVFASQPVKTWVALRVHSDPGTVAAIELGALVTATAALLEVDPKNYFKSAERLTLQTPFAVPQGAQRGLVLALARGSSAQEALTAPPFLHGNWLLYEAHNLLDVAGPVYNPHHTTYAGWPRGVRLPDPPAPETGSLLVRVAEAPAGNLLPNIQASVQALAPGSGLPQGPILTTLKGTVGGRLLADGLKPPGVALELSGLGGAVAAKGADGWPLPWVATATVAAGEVNRITVKGWVLPQLKAATWDPATLGEATSKPLPGTKATVQVEIAPLSHFGDQPMRLELRLSTSKIAAPLWPAAPQEHVVDLQQVGADDNNPAHFAYALAVDAGLLSPAADGSAAAIPLSIQARLHYVAAKAGPAPQDHRGPWVAVALQPLKGPIRPADADTQQSSDTENDSTVDASPKDAGLADIGPGSAPDSSGPSPTPQPSSGCSASAQGGWGGSGAWLGLLMVIGLGWVRRTRPSLAAGSGKKREHIM